MTTNSLPEVCFIYRPHVSTGRFVGIIRRGESGVFDTDYAEGDPQLAKEYVREMNAKLGVTEEQLKCMEIGSMFGWTVPGAQLQRPAQEHNLFDTILDDENLADA
jgi:hypothetical protein